MKTMRSYILWIMTIDRQKQMCQGKRKQELDWKNAECRRIGAFELWCCRRLLRIPWTAGRSNQSILKEISPGCSLEGLMLKAETPVLWPPHAKS